MKKKAFTLIEIMVTVAIVGILATIGIPAFQNVMESSKEKVCETNLKTLKKAVEMYIMDYDVAPGSLSELKDEHIRKAYASVMSEKGGWEKRLAYFLVEGPQWGLAYAQGYGMPKLRCPSNPNPAAISYGLNVGLANMSAQAYKNLGDEIGIIADSGGALFQYTNVPSPQGGPSTGYYSLSYEDLKIRGHRLYNVLRPAENYFKIIDKGGRTGTISYSSDYHLDQ